MSALTGLTARAIGRVSLTSTIVGAVLDAVGTPIDFGLEMALMVLVHAPDPVEGDLDFFVEDQAAALAGAGHAVPPLSRSARKLMPGVAVTYPTPVITNGQPVVPLYVANCASDVTLIEGPHDIHWIPDPDPAPGDPIYNPPPPAGPGTYRWTIRDLPAPPDGGYYWLGDPDSRDGTTGIDSSKQQWHPNGGSGPPWRSIYPYKPSVREHVYYGKYGKSVTETSALRFNIEFIEHMWLDFGSFQDPPYTWILAGIIMDFPYASYKHALIDMGGNPRDGGIGDLNEFQLAGSRVVHEDLQDYRPQLVVGIDEQITATNKTSTHRISQPCNYTTRPHMWFGVFNGAHSYAGSYSTAGKQFRGGSLDAAANTRHVLLGRRSGVLSRGFASHLVLFEARWFDSALAEEQLDGQYGQLSSTWRFRAYDS